MSYTFELNNERRDANFVSGKINGKSAVVEIFSAMTEGKDLSRFGKKADVAANYIMELNNKAAAGDMMAVSELNDYIKNGWCSYDYQVGPESFKVLSDKCPIVEIYSQKTDLIGKL